MKSPLIVILLSNIPNPLIYQHIVYTEPTLTSPMLAFCDAALYAIHSAVSKHQRPSEGWLLTQLATQAYTTRFSEWHAADWAARHSTTPKPREQPAIEPQAQLGFATQLRTMAAVPPPSTPMSHIASGTPHGPVAVPTMRKAPATAKIPMAAHQPRCWTTQSQT